MIRPAYITATCLRTELKNFVSNESKERGREGKSEKVIKQVKESESIGK